MSRSWKKNSDLYTQERENRERRKRTEKSNKEKIKSVDGDDDSDDGGSERGNDNRYQNYRY